MAENYDEIYQQQAWFGSRESHLLRRHTDIFAPGTRVLDIGVGQGRNALPLARRRCRVTGIDTSGVAVESVRQAALAEALELELATIGFLDFTPAGDYDVVLCFGLLQILSPRAGASLISRLQTWTRPGGVLFLTAWHVDDPSFPGLCDSWQRLGLRSFRSPDGQAFRTFLGRGEILQFFYSWHVLHHWEGLGDPHRHGTGPVEQHGDIEAVLRRPSADAR